MPALELPFVLITRTLEPGILLGEAMLFSEVMAVSGSPASLHGRLRTLARQIAERTPPIDLHRRMAPPEVKQSELLVNLEPVKPTLAWRGPIPLRLHVVRWKHGSEAAIAMVPALGITIVAEDDEELDKLIPQHVKLALSRLKVINDFAKMVQLDRVRAVEVEHETLGVAIKTPQQIATDAENEEPARPVIEEVGQELHDERVEPAYELKETVTKLAEALVGRHAKSVLLVGPSGVGKTAAFQQLFLERAVHRLKESPFWMTSGARLVVGMSGFGMWQERCQKLAREAHKAGAIVHLGNLVELMEVGKAGGSSFGIASFFRPILSRGDFLAVAECTPEQLPLIEKNNPHLLAVFHPIRVEPPFPLECKLVLHGVAERWRDRKGSEAARRRMTELPISETALDTIERLHRRYATYSSAPGRPLRFMKNLLHDAVSAGEQLPIESPRVTSAFAKETGLPLFLLDDQTPIDLEAARKLFGARVIGQSEAVDLVVDLLATTKASLNRPRRPIASLTFIGPTGVGKTEMAKSLADYFFGSQDSRLVRFDMSEYSTPAAVARLVGTAWEAEGLLTAKIREQPFCVVLFDEFEKAHPAFFDLLLQVLGEGRLTDSAGRVADFSNAIVIMTSNLGAAEFGSGTFGLSKAPGRDAKEHFTNAVRGFLRPEMFNRIDRVVPFLPLSEETIRMIAARELSLVARRDGLRGRNVALDVAEPAVEQLAKSGYDVRYGARPLKRRIERDLLSPLADALNQYDARLRLEANVWVAADGIRVEVKGATAAAAVDQTLLAKVTDAAAHRRRLQAVARCSVFTGVESEIYSLLRLHEQTARDKRLKIRWTEANQKRLTALTDLEREVSARLAEAVEIEDGLLLHLYEGAAIATVVNRRAEAAAALDELLLRLYSLRHANPDAVTIGLYGESHKDVFMLARAYREAIASMQYGCAVSWFSRAAKKNALLRHDVEKCDEFLAEPMTGVIGIALAVSGPHALPRLEGESGLHLFSDEAADSTRTVLVDTSQTPLVNYQPPQDVEFRGAITGTKRRSYLMKMQEFQDHTLGTGYRWGYPPLGQVIAIASLELLHRRLRELLDG